MTIYHNYNSLILLTINVYYFIICCQGYKKCLIVGFNQILNTCGYKMEVKPNTTVALTMYISMVIWICTHCVICFSNYTCRPTVMYPDTSMVSWVHGAVPFLYTEFRRKFNLSLPYETNDSICKKAWRHKLLLKNELWKSQ